MFCYAYVTAIPSMCLKGNTYFIIFSFKLPKNYSLKRENAEKCNCIPICLDQSAQSNLTYIFLLC